MGIKNRFELGEIDPWNWGQYTGDEYQLAVAWLENFQVLPQGGLNRRRGYERLTALPNAGAIRLVHIVAEDKDYVLELRTGGYGIFDCEAQTYQGQSYTEEEHPKSEDSLNRMRYCTRKNVAAFVAEDCRPFYIKVEGGSTEHGLIEVNIDVPVIESKPESFTAENRAIVLDKAVESLAEQEIEEEDAAKNHPTDQAAKKDLLGKSRFIANPRVIAYIANRVWLANTEEDPNKIWVSRRTEDLTKINLSTYNIYATVFEEYLAFQGRNKTGEPIIDQLDGNGHRLSDLSHRPLRDTAPRVTKPASSTDEETDTGEEEPKEPVTYRVDYGIDPTMINRTAYFPKGGFVKGKEDYLEVSAKSEGAPPLGSQALEEEYTEEAIAQTEAEYTRKMNMFAARDFKYMGPGGIISANCYGVEIFVVSINPKISSQTGYQKGLTGNGEGKEVSKVSTEVKTQSVSNNGTISGNLVGGGQIVSELPLPGVITYGIALDIGTLPSWSLNSNGNYPYGDVSSEATEWKIEIGKEDEDETDPTKGKKDGSGSIFSASFGADVTIQQLVPFTAWGEDWDTASIKAAAGIGAAAKLFATGGYAMALWPMVEELKKNPDLEKVALVAGLAGIALDPLFLSTVLNLEFGEDLDEMRDKMKERCKKNLNLTVKSTDGTEKKYTLNDVGLDPESDIHPDYLTNILQYIKTKYTLYSKTQAFVGIYHSLKVEEASTADCGFTFEIAGGTGEFIHDIEENQHILILTSKSERMADYTINGETQLVRKIGGEGCEFVKPTLTGAALYMMRTGNRSLQKLQWQPAMNAPSMIQTNQRNSDILDGFETRFLYASETYPKKIRLISKDGEVRGVQLLLGTEAFYRETTHGKILDMQCFKSGQDENVYVARKDGKGVWLDVLVDSIGRKEHIFLDSWKENGDKAEYDSDAVLYDLNNDRVYLYDMLGPPGEYYIGYPYTSKMRTLPTVGFGDMRPVRLPRVKVRLLDSCMPFINGYPEGDELNPNIITDQQNRRSGVFDVPVPGTNHRDAAYEIYTMYPDSLSILAICEEGL
jgi:hypothetical protein